jgi:hypothetical protein
MAETNAVDTEFRERLRRYEDRMHPLYALGFDGAKLTLRENGQGIMSWPAVSGRPGTQAPEHQSYRDHGPLPQGAYRAKVGEMQRYEDVGLLKRAAGAAGYGPWPWGTPAWGNFAFG